MRHYGHGGKFPNYTSHDNAIIFRNANGSTTMVPSTPLLIADTLRTLIVSRIVRFTKVSKSLQAINDRIARRAYPARLI